MGTPDKNKIKHFDFQKKPITPCFLMNVAKGIISWPDLKKRGAVLTKTNIGHKYADVAKLAYALVSEANELSSCEFESHRLHQSSRKLELFI